MTTPATTFSSESDEIASPASSVAPRVRSGALSWAALAAVLCVGVSFFWAFDALPFMDLPAHAGLIALRHRYPDSEIEQASFVVSMHLGPYSLFRALGELFVGAIGPVRAVRVIATLPLLATPLALTFARRRLHGDRSPLAAFVGVTLSFGLMTLLGFANYLLGVAVLVVLVTLWLELLVAADDGASTFRRELLLAAAAAGLFVSHGHAYVIFLGIAGVTCLAAGDRRRRLLRLRALVPSFLLAAWSASVATGTPAGSAPIEWASGGAQFQGVLAKLSLLVTPTLTTRTGIDSSLAVLIWIVVGAATVATARSLSSANDVSAVHARGLLAAAAACALAFFALPHAIGWFGFVDGRFVPLVLMLCFMALRRPALGDRLQRVLDRGAIFAAALVTILALAASYRFQGEARGYEQVLGRVPAGARLLNLPIDADSDVFAAHPFIHYDKLVLADRPVVVSDLWFHQGTGVFPKPGNPALALPESYVPSDLKKVDWPAYRLEDWDYVLVRTRPAAHAPVTPAALELVEHDGGWWLYRRM